MIAYGCYPEGGDWREARERIVAICREHKLGKPHWRKGPPGVPYVEALVAAVAVARRGGQASIIGTLDDIVPPENAPRDDQGAAYTDVEWRESWLAYAEARGIAFYPLPTAQETNGLATLSRSSVIRSYQRAMVALEKVVQAKMSEERRSAGEQSFVSGRPPFGYHVSRGRFQKSPAQADAIKALFSEVLAGQPVGTIIEIMQRRFPDEYWDRVKVKRILSHAPLYCLGVYSRPGQAPVTMPELVFLPAEWAKLGPAPAEEAEASAAVSSPGRSGTLGATTPPRRSP